MISADLDYILQNTQSIWPELQGKTIFMTGGTGFMGTWLLETFLWANKTLQLDLSVIVLARNIHALMNKAPHLAVDPAVILLKGDVRDFVFPHYPDKDLYIIHAATEANARFNQEYPQLMLDTIYMGTRRIVDFFKFAHAKKMLFLSSGAVYGKQPADMLFLEENYQGALNHMNAISAYAVGKHTAEFMCALHAEREHLDIKIARCFAFVGPYLPLNRHFAIGNFIRDALAGGSIHVESDGNAIRSYQYAADLVIWLLHILCFGERGIPYNVGSSVPIVIAQLAKLVANIVVDFVGVEPEVIIAKSPSAISPTTATTARSAERYLPSVKRAKQYFGFGDGIGLAQAIQKTMAWYHEND